MFKKSKVMKGRKHILDTCVQALRSIWLFARVMWLFVPRKHGRGGKSQQKLQLQMFAEQIRITGK